MIAMLARGTLVLVPIAALLSGCGIDEVLVRGYVDRQLPVRDDGSWPLSQGTVRIVDADGERYSETTTSRSGTFRALPAPAGETIFAEITGEGLGTTSFTGVSGLEDRMEVLPGTLYGWDLDELADLRQTFAGCPGASAPGGVVLGEVRVFGLSDPETGEAPLVGTAEVSVVGLEGAEIAGCYYTADGRGHDPEATQTGDSGAFVIFGVPSGVYTLSVVYSVFEEGDLATYTVLWMPEGDDAVVPRIPTWVEFPF